MLSSSALEPLDCKLREPFLHRPSSKIPSQPCLRCEANPSRPFCKFSVSQKDCCHVCSMWKCALTSVACILSCNCSYDPVRTVYTSVFSRCVPTRALKGPETPRTVQIWNICTLFCTLRDAVCFHSSCSGAVVPLKFATQLLRRARYRIQLPISASTTDSCPNGLNSYSSTR
jgi:hypothetical protein